MIQEIINEDKDVLIERWKTLYYLKKEENEKQYQEIEKLNKELKSLQDSYDIEEEQANYHIDLTDDLREEVDRLNNIIKDIKKCIDYYAIENDDFSKFYNNEEIEILKIIGSDKVE